MAKKRLPSAQRREQIASATLEILATRGAGQLTAAELAGVVGVSDAALFRHFRDMKAIVEHAVDVFETRLLTDFPPRHADPIERLRLLFLQRMALGHTAPHIIKLAFDDALLAVASPSDKRRVRRAVRRSLAFMHAALVEAQKAKRIAADVSPWVLVWMVTGVIRGASASLATPRKGTAPLTPSALWNDVERMLCGPKGG